MNEPLNCENLLQQYLDWLRSNLTATSLNSGCEITTPFLDRHNDFIQFYAEKFDDQIRLTDDGHTLRDLELSGVDLTTPKRRQFLNMIVNGLGVSQHGDELTVTAPPNHLAKKQHALIQAILSVNDMYMTAKPHAASLFHEDVEQFLHDHEIRFTPHVQFVGKSGFLHTFDFVVPASGDAPERLIRAINRPKRDAATSIIFAWNDTKRVRRDPAVLYVFLNDEDQSPSGNVVSALKEYEVKPILWHDREEYATPLAA